MVTTAGVDPTPRRAPLIFMGIFAALAAGGMTLLLVGELWSVLVLVGVLGLAIGVASFGNRRAGTVTLFVLTILLIGSITVVGIGAAQIAAAVLADSSGPAAPADEAELTVAEAKIRKSSLDSGFRLELSEQELNAVLQDSLAESDSPFERVAIDITNDVGDPGRIEFEGTFKGGELVVSGVLSAEVMGAEIELEIVEVDVGMFTVPTVGRNAVEDMIASVADLEAAIAEEGADIQEITIGDDAVVVMGVNRGENVVTSEEILEAFADSADLTPESVDVVARFPEGRAEGTRWPGIPVYLALGDSLAANVGVDTTTQGYVSRFHTQLEDQDGATYGMTNLAVSGETSGTFLEGGQLEEAEALAAETDVTYVTIDIGANDLLGHLGAPVCSEDIRSLECQGRIEATLSAYERNISEIFNRLDAAFPDATVIMLTAYNPFSFGFGDTVLFEAESNATLERLNTIATLAAVDHGFVVADGFTPMQATVATTTHMSNVEPDVHPNALGYDVLTGALWDALTGR